MAHSQHPVARDPQDLLGLFISCANAGDVEGLVALYEPEALLAAGDVVAVGHAEIRRFYVGLLERRSTFPAPEQLPMLRNGDVAMTFAVTAKGAISVELARLQDDGAWRWAIDQLKIKVTDGTG